ncbi:MAG: T9SS type A sorting domain-containing protein, partial [Bacteroidia bacterium]|nr:T9SS type A sorting domain-containing protein [Bacteroidia bacterium]
VLFIGNSYTYVNNLPQLVKDLALSKGDTLIFDSSAPGGYTFFNHYNDITTKNKISQGNWDYVVLQAQSQEPSFSPGQVSSQTLPYAILLDSLIKHYNSCATTVFYETWGRKFGDAGNCANYPPLCTYTGMQNRLRESYQLFADTTKALMAPVGEAFRLSIATTPTLDLYQSDQSHPSMEGSYLAASVFYETLFQKSVLSTTYNAGLAAGTATYLNQVAHQITSDSIYITNIPKYIPKAAFTFTAQGTSGFQFQSTNPNFLHYWYFGDGTTSAAINPLHTYTNSGTYPVSLVVYNAPYCKKDSVSTNVQVTVPTGLTKNRQDALKLYPNPCSDFLKIELEGNENVVIRITNISGQLIYEAENTKTVITSAFPKGFYNLDISGSFGLYHSCFIKNE